MLKAASQVIMLITTWVIMTKQILQQYEVQLKGLSARLNSLWIKLIFEELLLKILEDNRALIFGS